MSVQWGKDQDFDHMAEYRPWTVWDWVAAGVIAVVGLGGLAALAVVVFG